jgi:hypothetical protein
MRERLTVSLDSRIEALRAKHAELEKSIHEQEIHPKPDDDIIHALKKQKLRVKDELARLQH